MSELRCQSCGMPLNNEELFGSEKDGTKCREYCAYCYKNGEFTQTDISLGQMTEYCVPFLQAQGMEEEQAREILKKILPTLKRWKL